MPPKKYQLPDHEIIEVVLKKKMTNKAYRDMLKYAKGKGWEVQVYEVGFYNGKPNGRE